MLYKVASKKSCSEFFRCALYTLVMMWRAQKLFPCIWPSPKNWTTKLRQNQRKYQKLLESKSTYIKKQTKLIILPFSQMSEGYYIDWGSLSCYSFSVIQISKEDRTLVRKGKKTMRSVTLNYSETRTKSPTLSWNVIYWSVAWGVLGRYQTFLILTFFITFIIFFSFHSQRTCKSFKFYATLLSKMDTNRGLGRV